MAIAAGITVYPMSVSANAGIGFFMLAIPLVVLALIPAVILEGLVLSAILRLRKKQAFSLSLSANIRSTLYGFVLGIAIDFILVAGTGSAGPEPTKWAASVMLVPFFLFSWWIEHRVVARRETDIPRRKVVAATGAANVLSYAGMLIFIWSTTLLPERPTMFARMQISGIVSEASSVQNAVTEFWEQNNRFPVDTKELGVAIPEHTAFSIALEKKGRVLVQIRMPNEPLVDNKYVILTPMPDTASSSDGRLKWKCGSEGIPLRYLPHQCRSSVR